MWVALIFYCYATNDHKYSGLKQNMVISLQSPWVRSPGTAELDPLLRSREAALKVSARLCSHLEAQPGRHLLSGSFGSRLGDLFQLLGSHTQLHASGLPHRSSHDITVSFCKVIRSNRCEIPSPLPYSISWKQFIGPAVTPQRKEIVKDSWGWGTS